MVLVTIDEISYIVKEGISLIEACKYAGIFLPRFCYHESLSIAGNCRMCLVRLVDSTDITEETINIYDLEEETTLIVACCKELEETDLHFLTNDAIVKKTRENILEFLLLNHPLDCPICDQAGECDLQDQTKNFSFFNTKYYKTKESVLDKSFNSFINAIMTRCIHCTRCIRYSSEICESTSFGMLNRGGKSEIGFYNDFSVFKSEISGNVIDLCPVGALTSKNYSFKGRPWELSFSDSIDLLDAFGSNIYINSNDFNIVRILPKINSFLNKNIISDKCRFSFDSLTSFNLLKNPMSKKSWKHNNFIDFYNYALKKSSNFKKTTVIINEELNLEQLEVLKNIVFENNRFILKSIIKNIHHNIFFNKNNFIREIDDTENNCFFFAVNPRTECALLNTRLRYRLQNISLKIFSFGSKIYFSNKKFYTNFNLTIFLYFIEGKIKYFSKELIEEQNSAILIGTTLYNRGITPNFIEKFLLSINYSIILFNIFLNSNSFSNEFCNIKAIKSKDFIKTNCFYFINLKETIFLKKKFFKIKKQKIFWLNTFKTSFKFYFGYQVPIKNAYETNGMYMNMEGRPQISAQLFVRKNLSLETFFSTIYATKKIKNSYIKFKEELIYQVSNFDDNKYYYSSFIKFEFFSSVFFRLNSYPLKPRIKNFFLTNYMTIQSSSMWKAAKAWKSSENNFFNY